MILAIANVSVIEKRYNKYFGDHQVALWVLSLLSPFFGIFAGVSGILLCQRKCPWTLFLALVCWSLHYWTTSIPWLVFLAKLKSIFSVLLLYLLPASGLVHPVGSSFILRKEETTMVLIHQTVMDQTVMDLMVDTTTISPPLRKVLHPSKKIHWILSIRPEAMIQSAIMTMMTWSVF